MFPDAKMMGFLFTTDYGRAREFFEEKLEFEFVSLDEFALVLRAGQDTIRIAKIPNFHPAQGTVLGWRVPDITATVHWLNERGVACEKYPFVQDQDLGIWTAPSGDRVAWFKDPDGNVLGVSEHRN